jgi:ribonuclease HI
MKNIEMYTDGACSGNPGPGGYGAVILFKEHRKEISGGYTKTTNNRMEVMAVIKGLETLKEKCVVTVYSDSKYVVDAVEKGWALKWQKNNWIRGRNNPVINPDLWQQVLKLLNYHEVKFVWVKGHANNKENERCDFLATEYIKQGILEVDEKYISI